MSVRVCYHASYANPRRRGQAWLAQVLAWDHAAHAPTLRHGETNGIDAAVIEAEPGDLVSYGRWDKQHRTTTQFYAIVLANGDLKQLSVDPAFRYWRRMTAQRSSATSA